MTVGPVVDKYLFHGVVENWTDALVEKAMPTDKGEEAVGKFTEEHSGALIGAAVGLLGGPVGAAAGFFFGSQFDRGH